MTDDDAFDGGTGRTESARGSSASRRRLLAGAGVTLGAGVLGIGGSTLANDEGGGNETETGTTAATETETGGSVSDVEVLQYALTLERLEATFYQRGMETFQRGDFRDSEKLRQLEELQQLGVVRRLGDQVHDLALHFVRTLGSHERTHAERIESVLRRMGEEPADPPEFTFQFETVDEFLVTGQVLENTGVAAYAGAAPHLQSEQLVAAALSIHSVEARHAAFLNGVTGTSPFPRAFDPALSMDEVREAIEPFLADGTETATETETPAGD